MRYSLPLIALAICNLCIAANSAPQASVHLNNALPTTYSTLTASVEATDADGDAILLTYVWKVNGTTVKTIATTSHTDSLNLGTTGVTDKTQEVIVEVTPNDGTVSGQTVAALVTATRFQKNPDGDTFFADVPLGSAFTYDLIADGGISDTPAPTVQITGIEPTASNLADFGVSFSGTTFSSPELLKGGCVTVMMDLMVDNVVRPVNFVLSISRDPNANTPQIISRAVATPNPAQVGEAIAFSVVATDADGDALSCFWDFGDGTTDVANNRKFAPSHAYSAPGSYGVVVSISDGKHIAGQRIELIVTQGQANAVISTFKLALNFQDSSRSTMAVSGVVPLPPGGVLAGTVYNVTIPGSQFTRNFVVDAKGTGGDKTSRLTVKASKGGGNAKYTLKIQDGGLPTKLQPLGFQNAKISRPGVEVRFPFSIGISNSEFGGVGFINTNYQATNKSGKASLR